MGKMIEEAWDLEVFKRAYRISLDIHKISKKFSKEELFGLTQQLRRSTKSICANLAEGFAKQPYSKAEFKRFITMSVGSAVESRVWIRYCVDLEYLEEKTARKWADEYAVITKMLRKFHASIA